jgi:hypothetical protein
MGAMVCPWFVWVASPFATESPSCFLAVLIFISLYIILLYELSGNISARWLSAARSERMVRGKVPAQSTAQMNDDRFGRYKWFG